MFEKEHFDIFCKIKAKTPKAVLVYLPELEDEIWIPLSVISNEIKDEDIEKEKTIFVESWFCEQNDLE